MSTAIGRNQVRYTMRLTNGLHPHWTKDQVLSHFLQKTLFRYFLLNWALNDDFRFNQYSRKLHDAESGPSSSSFSKRCLPHFQQFSCSLMILLFHFLSCSYFWSISGETMHAGGPLTPSVMMTWEIFSYSAIFDQTEGQPRCIFQTNIKIFHIHMLLYYLSFFCCNPNILQCILWGGLFKF